MAAIHRAVVAVSRPSRYAVASASLDKADSPETTEQRGGRPAGDSLFRELVSGSGGTYARPGQQSLAVPWVTAAIRG